MRARSRFATQPTASPTAMPQRNENASMPPACDTDRSAPPATWMARANTTSVVPSLMSDSALSTVMERLGSFPLSVATAVASVGARAAPMISAVPQSIWKKWVRTPAMANAVTMTSTVPEIMITRRLFRTSRSEVLRASQNSMIGRNISKITYDGSPTSRSSCMAGSSANASPRKISRIAGVTRIRWASVLPRKIAAAKAIMISSTICPCPNRYVHNAIYTLPLDDAQR